jgi:hypothetical protein
MAKSTNITIINFLGKQLKARGLSISKFILRLAGNILAVPLVLSLMIDSSSAGGDYYISTCAVFMVYSAATVY